MLLPRVSPDRVCWMFQHDCFSYDQKSNCLRIVQKAFKNSDLILRPTGSGRFFSTYKHYNNAREFNSEYHDLRWFVVVICL